MMEMGEVLEKKPYMCPKMAIKRIDFSDVIVTSGGLGEPTVDNRPPSSDTPSEVTYDGDDPFG